MGDQTGEPNGCEGQGCCGGEAVLILLILVYEKDHDSGDQLYFILQVIRRRWGIIQEACYYYILLTTFILIDSFDFNQVPAVLLFPMDNTYLFQLLCPGNTYTHGRKMVATGVDNKQGAIQTGGKGSSDKERINGKGGVLNGGREVESPMCASSASLRS